MTVLGTTLSSMRIAFYVAIMHSVFFDNIDTWKGHFIIVQSILTMRKKLHTSRRIDAEPLPHICQVGVANWINSYQFLILTDGAHYTICIYVKLRFYRVTVQIVGLCQVPPAHFFAFLHVVIFVIILKFENLNVWSLDTYCAVSRYISAAFVL